MWVRGDSEVVGTEIGDIVDGGLVAETLVSMASLERWDSFEASNL